MSKIKLTLIKSLSGRLKAHQACAKGLGIKKIHKTIEVNDTPENRGMINKINSFIELARIDKPIGIYLLLWPSLLCYVLA